MQTNYAKILARVRDNPQERAALNALKIKEELSQLRRHTAELESLVCQIHPVHINSIEPKRALLRAQAMINYRREALAELETVDPGKEYEKAFMDFEDNCNLRAKQ